MAKLSCIEGIGEVYSGKLKEAGVGSPDSLLRTGATPKGRKEIAEKSGINEKLILEWVNHIDLFRIKGVGSEYADLLEEAGVDTVVELAQRKAANLYAKMVEVNQNKRLVRRMPLEYQVASWIEEAKTLPRLVQY